MKDMFYNYDNCIDRKTYPRICPEVDDSKILESGPELEIVTDVKGNELGVRVRKNFGFTLFFSMDGCVNGGPITTLVENSTTVFEIVDAWHKVVFSKEFYPDRSFISDCDTLKIEINADEADLIPDTYYMRLTLCWPGGKYELFSPENGFITIK